MTRAVSDSSDATPVVTRLEKPHEDEDDSYADILDKGDLVR